MSEATISGREFSGSKLREKRLAIKNETGGKKGSQSWLAYIIQAHVTSVSDWERGANSPSPRHLHALARALDCEMDDLFEDGEETQANAEPFRGGDA